jgi:hypothetical protein
VSEQPASSNVHPLHREGTSFDDVVDHQIDLRGYTGNPYDADAIARTRSSAERPVEQNPVHAAAIELSNLNIVRLDAMRNEDKPFLQDAA